MPRSALLVLLVFGLILGIVNSKPTGGDLPVDNVVKFIQADLNGTVG